MTEWYVAVEAEKSNAGHDDLFDYCGVVTLILKGERIATTWRLYKCLMPPATHSLNFKLDKKET